MCSALTGSSLPSADPGTQALFILWFSWLPGLASRAGLVVCIKQVGKARTWAIICGTF